MHWLAIEFRTVARIQVARSTGTQVLTARATRSNLDRFAARASEANFSRLRRPLQIRKDPKGSPLGLASLLAISCD